MIKKVIIVNLHVKMVNIIMKKKKDVNHYIKKERNT